MTCPTCLAAEQASEETLQRAFRVQSLTIDRLRSNLDTFRLVAAQARILELEEALERVNRSRAVQSAAEVASELAAMDPRDPDLTCLFCLVENVEQAGHRKGCVWRRAGLVAAGLRAAETRRKAEQYGARRAS